MLQIYRAQLNFISVMKLFATLGFGSGLLMSLFVIGSLFFGETLANVLLGVLIFPLIGAFQAMVFGILGYPFYQWYCERQRGQQMEGRFAEVATKHEDSPGL